MADPGAQNIINVPGAGPAAQQADGSYVVTSGPLAGVKIGADGRVDPQSLAQAKARAQQSQGLAGALAGNGQNGQVNPNSAAAALGEAQTGAPGQAPPQNNVFGSQVGSALGAIPVVGGFLNNMTSTPSTAGVQGAANDAQTIQNEFLKQYAGLKPGQAPQMTAAQMQAAQLDPSQQAQFRDAQTGLVSRLQGTLNGTTPSVAQIQQQQAFDQMRAAQAGQAAAAGRGGNLALAMRTAANNIGNLGAQQASASALLRAQEQATAANQLGDVSAAARGQDIGIAGANAANQQSAAALNAQQQQQANANNQQSAITTRGQDITQQGNLGSLANQANSNQVGAQVGALNAQYQAKQAQGNMISNGLSLASLSDERAKTDIKPESTDDIRDFLAQIHPSSYRYKGFAEPKVGVMAQDVERSGMGRTLVRETPAGKAIDIPSATTAMLAALADVHKRVSSLESNRR